MHETSVKLVIETLTEVITQYGLNPSEISPKTEILTQTPLDSLGLAQVVVALEEKTGKDPFSEGFINFKTVEELAALYD